MPNDEKCTLHPSLRKAECSHCQGTGRGTRDNPKFTLKEGSHNGFPVIEVLKDGAAIHAWDSEFRFGRRKVQIMLACIDLLSGFWQSNGHKGREFRDRTVVDPTGNLSVRVSVKWHPNFERSDGEPVDKPYLHLKALPPDSGDIGLGLIKCRAICELQENLRRWLLANTI